MKNVIYIFSVLMVFLVGCSSPASQLEDLDLMSEGIPLKLKAPAGAKVIAKDMSIFKDITVKNDDKFYIQIMGGMMLSNDVEKRIKDERTEIEKLSKFSRIVVEEKNGFIFEKKDGDNLSYDFRRIRIQGDNEYVFQTGLIGKFTLEDVKLMFEASR